MSILFAAETSPTLWETFALTWGPAVPMFMVFCFYIHRLVFRVIPRGMSAIRATIVAEGAIAGKRHDEAMDYLDELAGDHVRRDRRRRRRRKKPTSSE